MNATSFLSWVCAAVTPALIVIGVVPAAAQRYGLREVHDVGIAGVNLVVAAPVGDFGRNVDVAGGLDLFAALNVGRRSPLALRLEGSYLVYGNDRSIVLQPYYPLAINTTYSIITLGMGPQLTVGEGPVRLYGFGTFGASYLSARSSYGIDGCGCDMVEGTDFDDWTPAVQTGGGLLLALNSRRSPIALDLGARYLSNGYAWYVAPGDVIPQPDGTVDVYPTRTRADLVMLHIGVTVGIR